MTSSGTVLHFDESGFTGNDLLELNQRYFCYAGIECPHDEAKEFVENIINKYKIQSGELKGRQLLKYAKGKRAILEIIEHFQGRFKFTFADKYYVLAGKVFEYCFEPCISSKSTIFYGMNFHRTLTHLLYIHFIAKDDSAIDIFNSFNDFVRNDASLALNDINQSFIGELCKFINLNIETIHNEMRNIIPVNIKRWLLDITDSSLFCLLEAFNRDHEELIVFCDSSKPLNDCKDFFDRMIGEKRKIFVKHESLEEHSLLVNLKEPVHFVDSKEVHGIQLADAIAAGCSYACNPNNNDSFSTKVREIVITSKMCINPAIAEPYIHADLTKHNVQLNLLVFQELLRRSKEGTDLLEGIEDFIFILDQHLKYNPMVI